MSYSVLTVVGNVQAVLVRGNKAYKLNRDHTPNNPKEKVRVTKAGKLKACFHVYVSCPCMCNVRCT